MPTDTTELKARVDNAREQDAGVYPFLVGCLMESHPDAVKEALALWEQVMGRKANA